MAGDASELTLRAYEPRSMLRVPVHEPSQPRFAVVDAHNHLGRAFGDAAGDWPNRPVVELLAELDRSGVRTVVDLDGQWGDVLHAEVARSQEPHPDRFVVFAGIDGDNVARDPRFGETEARRLRESAAAGARGLKRSGRRSVCGCAIPRGDSCRSTTIASIRCGRPPPSSVFPS
jgi:hypothetical protein